MKKSYLIHGGWALFATMTYLIGSQSDSSNKDQGGAGLGDRSSETPSLSKRANNDGLHNRGEEAGAQTARSRSSDDLKSRNLSEADLVKLGADIRQARNPLERRELFSTFLANLTPENAKFMREQIQHLDSDSSEFKDFHYAWGAIAGEEAVLNGAETPKRDMAITLAGWAGADPDAALAYFNGLSEEQKKNNDLKWGAAQGLADADPNLALAFALDRHQAGDKEANRLVDLATREVLRGGDVQEAASWATMIPDGPMQATAVSRVSREYAKQDSSGAAQWAFSLPSGDSKNRALWNSYREWASDDPQAAANQLNGMTSSLERDSATYGYVDRIAWEDPAAAIDWVNTISDDKMRQRALYDSARTFFRKDPEAAREWLPESGLSEKQQAEIIRRRR